MNKTIREQYIANEILRIGDIVKDKTSGNLIKIIDRGSNYVTVESDEGIIKKWLTEVVDIDEQPKPVSDFILTENDQIKMFGYETKNFDFYLSDFIIEQFSEFTDLYSKHQIIKLLDLGLAESTDIDKQYSYLEKVSEFYSKHDITEPLIVEAFKNELERKRISYIVASVAGIEPEKSPYATVVAAVKVLKDKYHDKKQWEVLWPFFKLVNNSGITGILPTLPFNFDMVGVKSNPDKYDPTLESITQLLEDNLDELFESFELEDIYETFSEDEYSEEELTEEQINEVLSMASRTKLGTKMRTREANLEVKRARALTRGASTDVLLSRARRMAETMLKRRMFRKSPDLMTRQEKERFEKNASRRKLLVAKLAQRLVGKVRMIQTARLHSAGAGHTANPGQTGHNTKTEFGAS